MKLSKALTLWGFALVVTTVCTVSARAQANKGKEATDTQYADANWWKDQNALLNEFYGMDENDTTVHIMTIKAYWVNADFSTTHNHDGKDGYQHYHFWDTAGPSANYSAGNKALANWYWDRRFGVCPTCNPPTGTIAEFGIGRYSNDASLFRECYAYAMYQCCGSKNGYWNHTFVNPGIAFDAMDKVCTDVNNTDDVKAYDILVYQKGSAGGGIHWTAVNDVYEYAQGKYKPKALSWKFKASGIYSMWTNIFIRRCGDLSVRRLRQSGNGRNKAKVPGIRRESIWMIGALLVRSERE